MITKAEIHAPVIDLALGVIDLPEWLKRFARLSYNIHKTGTAEAIEEAGYIESLQSTCYFECITKEQFIAALGERVNFMQTDSCSFAYTVAPPLSEDKPTEGQ